MPTDTDTIINAIARETLLIETLEPRGRDSLDFHAVPVGGIRAALIQAYEAGRKAAPPVHLTCPACHRAIEIRPIPTT